MAFVPTLRGTFWAHDKFSQNDKWKLGKNVHVQEQSGAGSLDFQASGQTGVHAGSWKCHECGSVNPNHQQGCASCATPGVGEVNAWVNFTQFRGGAKIF